MGSTLPKLSALPMSHMLATDLQETNEYRFSRKHIDKRIDEAIRINGESEAKVHRGVQYLEEWLALDHYESKNRRLAQLEVFKLEELVREIFVSTAHCQLPELFVSVTAQLAFSMGFDEHRDSISTIAEIVAVLCRTDAFDISKEDRHASMKVQSRLHLPEELLESIAGCMYMPPMVCKPDDIGSNYESPYLTFNDPLVLGKNNTHAGDLCLDIVNTQNQTAMKLDLQFLCTVEEQPTHALDTTEKIRQWNQFKLESYATYDMLNKQGNQFWLTYKYDKRGRQYAQGYHVTSQGSAFKKAMLELHHEELVEGVPS